MHKQVFFLHLLTIFVFTAYAQTDIDALRFSTTSITGTARNIGLGNTMGTIGADISTLGTNPAGIAKFSSTEFTLSKFGIKKCSFLFLSNILLQVFP